MTYSTRSARPGNLIYRTGTGLLLISILALAACSGGGTSSGAGGSSSSGNSPTATAPGPTATINLPQITVAYCTHLLPLATANQIIPASSPATTITQGNPNNALSGACNYVVSSSQVLLVIYFIPYHGPDPIPQSDIQSILSQAAGTSLTITTINMVSGIGDQAAYVEVTGSENGLSGAIHIFYVLEGSFIFDCFTESYLSEVMASQSQLQQCATTVDTNLRS
ncbi:MAG TPA: hypothetical protein VF739_09645 [Ktedonobacterales bacterium]